MTAPHFFVEHLAGVEPGAFVELEPGDARHALRSLRLRGGEAVTLADGNGGFARGRIAVGSERTTVARVEVLEVEFRTPASPRVVVAMAAPKGDRLSWAVQKLTEVGVDELILLGDAERAVRAVRAGGERGTVLAERLRRIAREAAMQSRRPFVMEIAGAGFEQALEPDDGLLLMLWEGAEEPLSGPLREMLDPSSAAEVATVRLLVGPEGSFSQAEVDRALTAGARLVTLGSGILRTETAALAGAVIALNVCGRLG